MQNRITNPFHHPTRSMPAPWQVDQRPRLRLSLLFVVFLMPMGGLIYRLVTLQTAPLDHLTQQYEQLTETLEPIASRDGRLISSDGYVLAEDVEQFSVLVHYRWMEDPPNEDWLTKQALSRLNRQDRRKPELVQQVKAEVLQTREQLWDNLAKLSGKSPRELLEERQKIQRRVERIRVSVEQRLREKRLPQEEPLPSTESLAEYFLESFHKALTTAPERELQGPLVLKEELDDHPLLSGVSLDVAAEIEAHPERFPGVRVELSTQRAYPLKDLACHLLGYRTRLTPEQLETLKATTPELAELLRLPELRRGRTGLEDSYDELLRGRWGLKRNIRNHRGEIIETKIERQPQVGQDVILTLNAKLQKQAEQLLDQALSAQGTSEQPAPKGGAILAVDVRTGAILAAASAPRFDLNLIAQPDPVQWQQLLDDPRQPFFPRVTRMAMAPGSVFKPLTAIALLQSGEVGPEEKLNCRGYLDRPDRDRCSIFRHFGVGHGPVDLQQALAQSCNVYFFQAARKLGPHTMIHWADQFGFGQKTGIDIGGEHAGYLPSPENLPEGERWYPGDTLGLSIGQSRLMATPLQIVRFMAAVANGGELVVPHLLAGTQSADPALSSTVQLTQNEWQPKRVDHLSPRTLHYVRMGLTRTISDPQGTGYKTVRLPEVAIAGKTGTAEVGNGKPDHAWFAGYAPAESPRVAFVIALEHGGSGGRDAGPIARELVQQMLHLGLLTPRVASPLAN